MAKLSQETISKIQRARDSLRRADSKKYAKTIKALNLVLRKAR